jgi:hypothetical protein
MNRTITMMVSLFISVFFLAFISIIVPKVLNKSEFSSEITEVQTKVVNGALQVSWQTETQTDGILHYRAGTETYYKRDMQFKKTHKLVTEPLSGDILYYVESCDVLGACAISEEMSVTI